MFGVSRAIRFKSAPKFAMALFGCGLYAAIPNAVK